MSRPKERCGSYLWDGRFQGLSGEGVEADSWREAWDQREVSSNFTRKNFMS